MTGTTRMSDVSHKIHSLAAPGGSAMDVPLRRSRTPYLSMQNALSRGAAASSPHGRLARVRPLPGGGSDQIHTFSSKFVALRANSLLSCLQTTSQYTLRLPVDFFYLWICCLRRHTCACACIPPWGGPSTCTCQRSYSHLDPSPRACNPCDGRPKSAWYTVRG